MTSHDQIRYLYGMTLEQRIEHLYKWLNALGDESIVKRFETLRSELEQVIGSRPDGSPITRIDLIEEVVESEEDVKLDRVHTQEEIEQHFRRKAANDGQA